MTNEDLGFDREKFSEWLLRSTDLTKRSASDVCSRLRRLSCFIDINRIRSVVDLEVVLIRSKEFRALGTEVRSQMKRSGTLYLQFLASSKAAKK